MPEIGDLRNRMDQITLDLVRLFKQRTDIAVEIGRVKKTIGKGVTDEAREDALRGKVAALAGQVGLEAELAAKFLNFLLSESVRVQSDNCGGDDGTGGGCCEGRQTHLSVFRRAKEMEREGRKVIHMEVGEPDFMPPLAVRAAMQDSFDRGITRYGPAEGRAELRDALARRISADHGVRLGRENILVTPGARFSVFLAVTTLLSPGDEMIIIEPAWPAYGDCARNAGVRVRAVRTTLEDRWEPTAEQVARAVNSSTRMLVLNYPNNPTGKILPAKLQDEIMRVARDNGLYVLSDEIYSRYARAPWKSVLEYGYDRAITVQSFSKSHAMTGFRVGYAVADGTLVKRMAGLQALSLTSVPEPMQYAAEAALGEDTSGNTRTVNSRLDMLASRAREAGLEFADPDGAMYLFARVARKGFDGAEFAAKALEEDGLALAPGAGFGDYGSFIRISACGGDEKTLKEGIDTLNRILERWE